MLNKLLKQAEAFLAFVDDSLLFISKQQNELTIRHLDPQSFVELVGIVNHDSGWLKVNKLITIERIGTKQGKPWFLATIEPQPKVKIDRFTIPLPRLIMFCWGTNCWIWAIKQPFTPKQKLYHAPLPNIRIDGEVCWGGITQLPFFSFNCWEIWQQFISSGFNSDFIDNKSLSSPENLYLQYQNREKTNSTKYPLNDLISTEITVEQFIDEKLNHA
jgi:hypothetical protein